MSFCLFPALASATANSEDLVVINLRNPTGAHDEGPRSWDLPGAVHRRWRTGILQGYLAHTKHPRPEVNHKALGIGVL